MTHQSQRKRNLERRLEKLREQKALFGPNTDPAIAIEIEDLEQELEQLLAEAVEIAERSPRRKINPQKLEKARKGYLDILEKDVNNRVKTSIHNARFIDISSGESPDSTYLPWLYQANEEPEVFDRFEKALAKFEGRVLLLGAPGSGKTTTLLHVAQQLIGEAQNDRDAPIPLLFNLSKFRGKDNLSARKAFFPWRSPQQTQTEEQAGEEVIADWLVQMMTEYADPFTLRKYKSPWVSRDVAKLWLEEEKVALLLDGLDEVDDHQLRRLVGYLNDYLVEHPEMTMVVCSRIVEYEPLKDNKETRLHLEGAVTLQPLNQEQIDSYLEKAKAIALRDALSDDQALYELAQSPLTLSMMTLAYGGSAPKDIPANLSLVERRRHLFDTYIDHMMQRKARRDRGIPFDLNRDNDIPPREYPYTRKQVARYLGWLAVRLSERMKPGLPFDQLYSFLAQEPENKQNQKFWTEVKLTNAVFIVLSIIAITVLLMPKTLLGIKQAALILSLLLPSSLFLGFIANCTFSERFPTKPILEYSMKTLTIASIVMLIVGAFGGLVNSLAVALPIQVSPLALGAIAVVAIIAFLYILGTLVDTPGGDRIVWIYLLVTAGSVILPLIPVLLGQETASLDIGIAASMVIAQSIFFVVKFSLEEGNIFLVFLLFLVLSVVWGIPVAFVLGLGITIISTPDWYETILLLGFSLGILGLHEENPRLVLVVTVLAALIGGCVANAVGSLIGALAVPLIIGLFLYSFVLSEQFIETIKSGFDDTADRLLYNFLLKFVLAINGSIPAHCNRFLNYTISAVLLKPVGTEYQFVHRLLRDHFAIRELVPIVMNVNAELKERLQRIEQLSFQGESAFYTLASLAQEQNLCIREAAIEGLGRVAIPEVVPLLQAALENSSIQVRETVIKGLGKLPAKDSEILLSKALKDSVLSVQLLAVSIGRERNLDLEEQVEQALEQIIARTPLPELLKVLHERDERVRQIAIEVLGRAGDSAAVPSLLKVLGDRNASVRSSAAGALGQIGDNTAVPELLKVLGDRDEEVRSSAAQALGQIGDSTAVLELLKALGDRDASVRDSAAEVLGRIGDSTAVPELIRALGDRHDWVRRSAAEALGQIGDSTAVPELIRALGDRHDWVRSSAAGALGQIGDSTAVPELLKALGDRHYRVRSSAAEALVQIGSAAVPELLQALGDRHYRVRSSAAEVLGRIGDSTAVPELIKALGDRHDWVRRSAAEALGQIGDSTAVPELLKALGDRDQSVRSSAAGALGQLGDSTAVPALLKALGDRDQSVRSSAAGALGQLGDSTAVPELLKVLSDGDVWVRLSAAQALGEIGDSSAVPALIKALPDGDDSVREKVTEALKKIGTPEALNALK